MRQVIMKILRDPNAGDDAGMIHSDHFRITDLIIRRRYTMDAATKCFLYPFNGLTNTTRVAVSFSLHHVPTVEYISETCWRRIVRHS